MKDLKTENLELTLDDNVVQMSVTGAITPDTLQSSHEWIETAQSEAKAEDEDIQICVDMKTEDFTDLSEASQQFRNVGTVLRRAHDVDRVAVVSDSNWIRNSAKVEGAVIPGLDVMAFSPEESETAEKWLRDEPLMEAHAASEPEAQTAVVTPQSPQKATSVPPSPPVAEAATSDNPWDSFSVKDVDL